MELPRYYPLVAYYPLIELIVCAFNAILFVLLSYYCIRDYRKRRTKWGGYIYACVVVLCAVLFGAHLGNDFAIEVLRQRLKFFDFWEITAKYLIPPLMIHLFYRNERQHLKAAGTWRTCIAVVYIMGIMFAAAEVNTVFGAWRQGWPGWSVSRPLFRLLMTVAAVGSGFILWTANPPSATASHRRRRRWLIGLCCAWSVIFVIGVALPDQWNSVLEKVIPLSFVFIITYYVERFTFFDVLVKKGAFVFASLLLLTLYFLVAPPLLWRLQFRTWVGTLVWAVSVWPIALFAPWVHRRLSWWVDRHFLGRRFSPAQATKYFLAGLEGAINEEELARDAEARLTTIFRSETRVCFSTPGSAMPENDDGLMTAPIWLGGTAVGAIRVHGPEQHMRFLSEDTELLASLADSFAFLLENLRLREKRLEQEQREQELVLNANLSELKALRAQVNPHFLFNALNTIAGLIPRQPERAEETVEELAEVFRYTLRRSEREWVQLDEELEAVRAYLHIEQARFGEGLRFSIDAIGDVQNVRIPAMIIQTLVENSVKHGIARLAGAGVVEIAVNATGSALHIEVRDNGPGFDNAVVAKPRRARTGYGLHNVKERLRGYFGDATSLEIGRDGSRNMTVVSIEMPRRMQAAGACRT